MKYKLLVAEDTLADRKALCATLTNHLGNRITVCEAKNGREALDLFLRENHQIIILDVDMPEISGLEVARKIRERSKTCAILFLSAFDNFSDAREAITVRALDYLQKPWDEKKLIASVEEAIQHVVRFSGLPWDPAISPRSEPVTEPESARLTLVREDISAYIEAHYTEELSMKNVAQAMNYSDAYFCKLFKQCFHVNFSTFLNEFRICRAKTMMENPRINVKDISVACGYTDSNYFARVFKRITGQTPSAYRLSVMEKNLRD